MRIPEFKEYYTTSLFTGVKKDNILTTEIRVMPGKEKKKCVRLPCYRKLNSWIQCCGAIRMRPVVPLRAHIRHVVQ